MVKKAAAADGVLDMPLYADLPPDEGGPLPGTRRPRWYQDRMVGNVCQAWEDSNSTLVVMATGTGKTFTAALLARRLLSSQDERDLLFLVHQDELVRQAYDTFRSVCPRFGVEIEQGEQRTAQGDRAPRIVVASKDTLHKSARLAAFDRERFGWVVIDECHRMRRNKSYWDVLDYFATAKRLGITATPKRSDGFGQGNNFDSCAFVYDLRDAILDGYLVNLYQREEKCLSYDLSQVRKTKDGDLNEGDLADAIRHDGPLHFIAEVSTRYACAKGQRRPSIVFMPSIQSAMDVADIINWRNTKFDSGPAASVSSESQSKRVRREIFRRYKSGEIQYLVNVGICVEGFDAPTTRLVVIGRNTTLPHVYEQMIGRVTRPHPDVIDRLAAAKTPAERKAIHLSGPKPAGMVVDLVGVSGKHKIVSITDVLGGRFHADVVAVARNRSENSGGRVSPLEALEAAAAETEQAGYRAMIADPSAIRERRHKVVIGAKTKGRTVDPFDIRAVSTLREPPWKRGRRPSRKQVEMLERAGYTDAELDGISLFHAQHLIGKLLQRRKDGRCTIPQARKLAKFGEDPEMSFADARRVLDAIKRNGWRPLR